MHNPGRTRQFRSLAWTFFLLPFVLLPYRWLWLPCAVAGVLLIWPRKTGLYDLIRKDGTLIIGSVLVLLLRTALDVTFWLPWVAFIAGLAYLRASHWLSAQLRPLLTLLACVAAALLILRPSEWPVKASAETIVRRELRIVCAGDSLTSGVSPGTDEGTYVADPCKPV